MIISLYAGGMTVRDIGHHLHRTLGVELSYGTVSTITDSVVEEVKAWQARPLEELYPILYLDALVVKVRDGHQVRNRAAHLAVGVDLDGVKHVQPDVADGPLDARREGRVSGRLLAPPMSRSGRPTR
jgi:putative transposase